MKVTITKQVKVFLIAFLCTSITILLLVWCLYKEPIQNASMARLTAINGIGEVLAERVYDYVKANPSADIADLIEVDGIGEQRLELIRKEFK